MKRIIATGLALALGIIAGGFACSGGGADITLEIGEITLNEVSFAESTIDVSVTVENKAMSDAVLEKIEYDIYVGRKDKWIWLARQQEGGLRIQAGPPTDFTVSTAIENAQLRRTIEEYILGTEPSEIKVDGHASFKVGDASIEVQFSKKTKVDTQQ